jgi:hypothetical protein
MHLLYRTFAHIGSIHLLLSILNILLDLEKNKDIMQYFSSVAKERKGIFLNHIEEHWKEPSEEVMLQTRVLARTGVWLSLERAGEGGM